MAALLMQWCIYLAKEVSWKEGGSRGGTSSSTCCPNPHFIEACRTNNEPADLAFQMRDRKQSVWLQSLMAVKSLKATLAHLSV